MAFKPYCNRCGTWHTEQQGHEVMPYLTACQLVEDAGMGIVDGLALTHSCADYPDWVRNMNGWSVEDAAREIEKHAGRSPPLTGTGENMALQGTLIGTTLSQVALAVHLRRSAKWVRAQGELVTGTARHMTARWQETWARMEYINRRCAGYKRVS